MEKKRKIEIAIPENCFTICVRLRDGEHEKEPLLSHFSIDGIHQNPKKQMKISFQGETHQHNTNYSNKNHLKNLFCDEGESRFSLSFGSGRPWAGLCFWENGKIEDPFFRVRGHWISSLSSHSFRTFFFFIKRSKCQTLYLTWILLPFYPALFGKVFIISK